MSNGPAAGGLGTPDRRPQAAEPVTRPRVLRSSTENCEPMPPLLERWFEQNHMLFPNYEIASWGIQQKFSITEPPWRLQQVAEDFHARWLAE